MGMYQNINQEVGEQKITSYAEISKVVKEKHCAVDMSDIFTCQEQRVHSTWIVHVADTKLGY